MAFSTSLTFESALLERVGIVKDVSHNSLRQALDALMCQHKEFVPLGTALWWSTPEQPNTVMVNARQAKADKRLEAKASALVTWELDAVPSLGVKSRQ